MLKAQLLNKYFSILSLCRHLSVSFKSVNYSSSTQLALLIPTAEHRDVSYRKEVRTISKEMSINTQGSVDGGSKEKVLFYNREVNGKSES